jgi:hypothetical protein
MGTYSVSARHAHKSGWPCGTVYVWFASIIDRSLVTFTFSDTSGMIKYTSIVF